MPGMGGMGGGMPGMPGMGGMGGGMPGMGGRGGMRGGMPGGPVPGEVYIYMLCVI